MKTKRLIAATTFATVMTLFALGGGAVQAHTGSEPIATHLSQVSQVPVDQHAATDVTMALSDLVDVDRALKTASLRERMSARAAFSQIGHSQAIEGVRGLSTVDGGSVPTGTLIEQSRRRTSCPCGQTRELRKP